jgi:DNA-binding Lrp family transcriptional regulator
LRIENPALKEGIARAMSDPQYRRIISATVGKGKSVIELADELDMSTRSVYRYVRELNQLGILIGEGWAFFEKGGKHAIFRSMVRSVTVRCEGEEIEVDLQPNEGILDRFMRFWSYMGR